MTTPHNMKQMQGFTLAELLIIIVIIGILSAMAAPSMMGMVRKNQLNSELRNLILASNEARSKAITLRKEYVLTVNTANTSSVDLQDSTGSLTLNDGKVKWPDTNKLENITFNYMGMITNLKKPNGDCYILQHTNDASIKKVILVQNVGTINLLNNMTDCSSFK